MEDINMEPVDNQPATIEYSPVMDKYAVCQVSATVDSVKLQKKKKDKSVFILCLDKSGSMSGKPMKAVKKGAYQVAKIHSETNTFDKFLTLAFDNTCRGYEFENMVQYEKENKKLNADGGTCFSSVFDDINQRFSEGGYEQYKDCTIMFMTDGLTNTNTALDSLQNLCKQLNVANICFRFFCIGFSSNHDADLLGKIARSGKELGNFVYIQENSANLSEEISGALHQAFDLAPGSTSLNAHIFLDTKDGYKMDTRLKLDENFENRFSAKITLPLEILKHEAPLKIKLESGTMELEKIEKVAENAKEGLEQALYFFNLHIFDLIIQAQEDTSKEKLTALLEETKEIDGKLNSAYQESLKIKLKEERKKIIEPIQEIKQKIVNLIQFLREKQLGHAMSNDFIAKLNAMAYSGARGTSMQKKLDNRALTNESRFTELQTELDTYVKTLDMTKLREENKEVSDQVGDCFLTTKDTFECIEDQDCLCICLDISRSKAAIVDPTKLVIRKIIPSFLSADSFIEAAQFALSNDSEAHGGFEKDNEAQILVGVGRENITGALPLFLFKEHFEIARKKIPQLLGLMCTCDPMGYTPSQFFIVPFLVLHRAFTDYHAEKSESKKFIFDQLLVMCKKILCKIDKSGKENTLKLLENLLKDPLYSTQEHLTSVPLLLAQLMVLKSSKKVDLDNEDLEHIFKVLIEECDRRSLDQKSSQLPDSKICSMYLYPELESDVSHILSEIIDSSGSEKKREEKEDEKMEVDGKQPPPKVCLCDSDVCKVWGKGAKKENKGDKKKEQKICPEIFKRVQARILEEKKWVKNIEDKDSPISKLISKRVKTFFKYQFWLKHYATEILGEESKLVVNLKKGWLPYSKNELAAVMIQNTQHFKNSFKKSAIESNSYISITSPSVAETYFEKMVMGIVSNSLKAAVRKAQKKALQKNLLENATQFNSTDDLSVAAELLEGYKRGRGDVSLMLENLMEGKSTKTFEKIKMIAERKFNDHLLESDKNANKSQKNQNELSQKKVFNLWLNCCKKTQKISEDEFFEYFSEYQIKREWWNKYFDAAGNPIIVEDEATRAARRGKKAKWRKRKALKK